MKPHFLQSAAWEEYQRLEGAHTFYLESSDFSARLILKSTPVGNYLFAPYGPTLRGIDPQALSAAQQHSSLSPELKTQILEKFSSALAALTDFARQHNAIFVRIEPIFPVNKEEIASANSESSPDSTLITSETTEPTPPSAANTPSTPLTTITPNDLEKLGLKKSIDLDPAHTWVVDLAQPEGTILKQMRTSNAQYWRSSAKKGLTVRQSRDPKEITILSSLLRGVANKDNFTPQDESHLKRQIEAGFATLYIAEYQPQDQTAPQTLAASLVYDDNTTRFYAHAATSDSERKLAAGTVLLVQMILDAQQNGTKFFDFWGVTTSDDKSHPWYGFTQYKKSFGGGLVSYAGTWDLPVNRSRYRLYRLVRRLNRLKRKIWK